MRSSSGSRARGEIGRPGEGGGSLAACVEGAMAESRWSSTEVEEGGERIG